jgi:hypothetical protein
VLDKAKALTSCSDFTLSISAVLNNTYSAYKNSVCDYLLKVVTMDNLVKNTSYFDYNFVAGVAPAYSPKQSLRCVGNNLTPFNFCEPHGINGGDPKFRDVSNPLGPDGIPFTLDDGLKPTYGSPFCGKGQGGTDIGVYSCDPTKVFADGSSVTIPSPSTCLSFTYSPYGICTNATQFRTITSSTPIGCTGGTSESLSRSCSTYAPADLNSDGRVNTTDFSLLTGDWNKINSPYDLNGDHIVNSLDYVIMVQGWTG